MSAGRFAPSPSGDLHLGNLRTAALAWLFARSSGRSFLLRIEDLDQERARPEAALIRDLHDLGLTWDGPIVFQSARGERYQERIQQLRRRDLLYPCFCTRRDIAASVTAPHGRMSGYPGLCRHLTAAQKRRLSRERPAAWRLRAATTELTIADAFHENFRGAVDDFVMLRNDGTPSYNFAVVVDDHDAQVDQVVRGDDLLDSTPRQVHLASLLGTHPVQYIHVPLVLTPNGQRLAKRSGSMTMHRLGVDRTRRAILDSLHLPATSWSEALQYFDPTHVPRHPWCIDLQRSHTQQAR